MKRFHSILQRSPYFGMRGGTFPVFLSQQPQQPDTHDLDRGKVNTCSNVPSKTMKYQRKTERRAGNTRSTSYVGRLRMVHPLSVYPMRGQKY